MKFTYDSMQQRKNSSLELEVRSDEFIYH